MRIGNRTQAFEIGMVPFLNDLSYISRFQPQTQSLGLVAIAELLVLLKWVS